MTGDGQGAFAAADAVGRYWLAQCEGFEVRSQDGQLTGVVAEVEHDPAGRALTLVVQRRRRRPVEISPAAVTLIDPWQEQVVVAVPAREPRPARVRPVAAAAWAHTSDAGRSVIPAARRAAPPARRFALWLGARTAYALAFAGWLYGAALYRITRAATRALLLGLREITRFAVWFAPVVAVAMQAVAGRAARLARRLGGWSRSRAGSAHWIARRH